MSASNGSAARKIGHDGATEPVVPAEVRLPGEAQYGEPLVEEAMPRGNETEVRPASSGAASPRRPLRGFLLTVGIALLLIVAVVLAATYLPQIFRNATRAGPGQATNLVLMPKPSLTDRPPSDRFVNTAPRPSQVVPLGSADPGAKRVGDGAPPLAGATTEGRADLAQADTAAPQTSAVVKPPPALPAPPPQPISESLADRLQRAIDLITATNAGVVQRDQTIAQLNTRVRSLEDKVADLTQRVSLYEAAASLAAVQRGGASPVDRQAGSPLQAKADAPNCAARPHLTIQSISPRFVTLAGGAKLLIDLKVGDDVPCYGKVREITQDGATWKVKTDQDVISSGG